jgi:hypothetical protein
MGNTVTRGLRRYALYFLIWTVIGLFFFSQAIAQKFVSREPTPWGHYLVSWMVGVNIWAILTPGLLWLGNRFPIPLALVFNPFRWTQFGPFFFQTSRILHYLVYFLIGAGAGASGLECGLLARDGTLARRWSLWAGASLWVLSANLEGNPQARTYAAWLERQLSPAQLERARMRARLLAPAGHVELALMY